MSLASGEHSHVNGSHLHATYHGDDNDSILTEWCENSDA